MPGPNQSSAYPLPLIRGQDRERSQRQLDALSDLKPGKHDMPRNFSGNFRNQSQFRNISAAQTQCVYQILLIAVRVFRAVKRGFYQNGNLLKIIGAFLRITMSLRLPCLGSYIL